MREYRECIVSVDTHGHFKNVKGKFHGWHLTYNAFMNNGNEYVGASSWTIGLVELEDGKIIHVIPRKIQFTNDHVKEEK